MSVNPRIAIIGAGPGGLTLALLLHKHNPSIKSTIFEFRQQPTETELSKPSGMLDLHDESGQAAIKACGLWDEFLTLTGECAEAQRVADKDGNILYADEGELSERPEISRHSLTKLLLKHLPAESIQWGHKLLTASRSKSDNKAIDLDFGLNGTKSFDLVVGADGAWSRVRKMLTDIRPTYSGKHNITLTLRNISKKYPHLSQLVGPGSFSSLGLNHGVMSQRGPQDSARLYTFVSSADEDFAQNSGLQGISASAAKDIILNDDKILGKFGPKMKELVSVACDEEAADHPGGELDIKAMYTLPVGHSWTPQPGATLIGDASHLMGPWAGEGVNLAMWDSLLLAQAITKAYDATKDGNAEFAETLDPLVKEFEVDMAARAKEKGEETAGNGEMLFGDDAANDFVRFFEQAYGTRHDPAQ